MATLAAPWRKAFKACLALAVTLSAVVGHDLFGHDDPYQAYRQYGELIREERFQEALSVPQEALYGIKGGSRE
jgi:hypothetical protein